MRFSRLSDWLAWLESCHLSEIELGLDRIGRVARRMGVDLSGSKVVSVAGTNGKGSCVAALNALCMQAGLTVGCYTSPHFLRYNERITIDGRPVTDDDLLTVFDQIDQALAGDSLTYFEFGTLAALAIFQREALDVVVLEVGLGGRLDAVNLVDADISVVTTVALDHQDWLGADREAIGFEKAGIFRSGRPAICSDDSPPQSLLDHARAIGADLLLRCRHFDVVDSGGEFLEWWSNGEAGSLQPVPGLTRPSLPSPSVAAALKVAELLGIDRCHWACLSTVELPGRYQRLAYKGKSLLLDVAHNPAAASLLAARLAADPCAGQRYALFAVMADKDIEGIIEPLAQSFAQWAVAGLPDIQRAAAVGDLAAELRHLLAVPVVAYNSVASACAELLSSLREEDELVVFGSFFTVSAVMACCADSATAYDPTVN